MFANLPMVTRKLKYLIEDIRGLDHLFRQFLYQWIFKAMRFEGSRAFSCSVCYLNFRKILEPRTARTNRRYDIKYAILQRRNCTRCVNCAYNCALACFELQKLGTDTYALITVWNMRSQTFRSNNTTLRSLQDIDCLGPFRMSFRLQIEMPELVSSSKRPSSPF